MEGYAARRSRRFDAAAVTAGLTVVAILAGWALARLSLMLTLLLTGGTAVVVVTLIEPLAGLALTLVAAPLAAYTNFMTGGVMGPLDTGQLPLALTLGAWLLRGLARREIRLPLVPLTWPLLLFAGWAATSLLWAPSFEYAIPELIKWIEVLLIVLIVVDAQDRRSLHWVLAGLLISGCFQGALGIWQHSLRGIGPETFEIGEGVYRAYGSFEQPNPYAGYVGLIWPIVAGLLIGQFSIFNLQISSLKSRISRQFNLLPLAACLLRPASCLLLLAACILLLVTAIMFSWSRGAWLGALAAGAVMAAALPRRRWLGMGLAALAAAALVGANAAGALPNAIRARLTDFTTQVQVVDVRGAAINDANYSVLERMAHWQAALDMWRAHLWTGVGISNYEPVYTGYALWNWPIALGHAHNYYLNVTAELGLPGLLIYLLLWGVILWQTTRAIWRGQGWGRGLAIGLLGAWAHLSVHHLFDNLYVNNTHLLIGALLGALAILNLDKPLSEKTLG